MKSINTNTILQIVALLFLVIIGYMSFSSGSNWKVIKTELERAQEELKTSKENLIETKASLQNSKKELERLNLQKDIFKRERDSILLEFERKNAADWNSLETIKENITENNKKLIADREILDSLFSGSSSN